MSISNTFDVPKLDEGAEMEESERKKKLSQYSLSTFFFFYAYKILNQKRIVAKTFLKFFLSRRSRVGGKNTKCRDIYACKGENQLKIVDFKTNCLNNETTNEKFMEFFLLPFCLGAGKI